MVDSIADIRKRYKEGGCGFFEAGGVAVMGKSRRNVDARRLEINDAMLY